MASRLRESDIHQIFSVFDADNSGSISAEEYRTALIAMGNPKVTISEASTMMGGKASINRAEFRELIEGGAEEANSMAEARRVFKLFDTKGTGRLTEDMLMKAGHAATGATPSYDFAQRMIEALDRDSDNGLDFKEFVAAVTLTLKIPPESRSPSEIAAQEEAAADAAAEAEASVNAGTPAGAEHPPGSKIKKILNKDVVFNSRGKLDTKAVRAHLEQLGYPEEDFSDDALQEEFDEYDEGNTGFLNEAEYRRLLVGLGELQE